MTRKSFSSGRTSPALSPQAIEKRRQALAAFVERNKLRRRPGEEPPAAAPAPVDPRPRGGGFSGGAAAMLEFED